MKKLLLSATLLIGVTAANVSNACTYYIDEAKKSAELEKVALASLGDAQVLSSSVSNFSYFESKPTPMCPKELTYNATVTVTYQSAMNKCVAQLKVKKVESWSAELDTDVYEVSGRIHARCNR